MRPMRWTRMMLAVGVAIAAGIGCGGNGAGEQAAVPVEPAAAPPATVPAAVPPATVPPAAVPQAAVSPAATASTVTAGLPEGFPVYPGARPGPPGNPKADFEWDTPDDVVKVGAYYNEQLNQGRWRVFKYFDTSPVAQTVVFQLADQLAPSGTVSLVTHKDLKGCIIRLSLK